MEPTNVKEDIVTSTPDPTNVVDTKGKGLEILEKNISGVPVTETQLQKLFAAFTADGGDSVSVDTLVSFYSSLDQLGVPRTEREVRWAIAECANTNPDSLTYQEFACFMLKISQW